MRRSTRPAADVVARGWSDRPFNASGLARAMLCLCLHISVTILVGLTAGHLLLDQDPPSVHVDQQVGSERLVAGIDHVRPSQRRR
eukprot:m.148722 g.148722  ORF g.148722 m.148722 type:complete len:85 (-) comp9722_c0_seq1:430-684(-)